MVVDHLSSFVLHFQVEIQRRKRQAANKTTTDAKTDVKNDVKNVVKSDAKPYRPLPAGMMKNDRHDQLMEEFRRVHRKMFSASTSNADADADADVNDVKEIDNERKKKEETRYQAL